MTKQLAATSLVIALLSGSSAFADQNYQKFQNMLDLSGIAWLENDRFLVVHDAKNPKEMKHTRISFLKPPSDDKHHQSDGCRATSVASCWLLSSGWVSQIERWQLDIF